MPILDKTTVEALLKTFIDPNVETDLVSAKSVKQINVNGNNVIVSIELGYPAKSYIEELKSQLTAKLLTLEGVEKVDVNVTVNIVSHSVQKALKPLANVKNIIAIASGKGGVGKSTTSVNLALALVAEGAIVGILDADIYGPSIPTMLGLSGQPLSNDGKTLQPKISFGVQTISIGYLVYPDQPMIWRGPMVTGALQQLLTQTNWFDVDYLIIDLPPGTGDIQLPAPISNILIDRVWELIGEKEGDDIKTMDAVMNEVIGYMK